jgi:hypothetical protein
MLSLILPVIVSFLIEFVHFPLRSCNVLFRERKMPFYSVAAILEDYRER